MAFAFVPDDEKYRKLKMSNKRLSSVSAIKGVMPIWTWLGFRTQVFEFEQVLDVVFFLVEALIARARSG